VFGWIKQWGGQRQFKLRGTVKVSAVFGQHVVAQEFAEKSGLRENGITAQSRCEDSKSAAAP